jgi:predicted ABC-type ATPase
LALEPGAKGHSDIRAGRVMLARIDELVSARADFVIETTLATLTSSETLSVVLFDKPA